MLFLILGALIVASDKHQVVGRVFRKAMSRCGMSLKEAAFHYGTDASSLVRKLNGDETNHVNLQRMVETMPTEFVQYFSLAMVMEFGLPAEVEQAQQIAARVS